jgi:hypothetical protein
MAEDTRAACDLAYVVNRPRHSKLEVAVRQERILLSNSKTLFSIERIVLLDLFHNET